MSFLNVQLLSESIVGLAEFSQNVFTWLAMCVASLDSFPSYPGWDLDRNFKIIFFLAEAPSHVLLYA
jgi:hypothetical protein